jgi:hypothetical protein
MNTWQIVIRNEFNLRTVIVPQAACSYFTTHDGGVAQHTRVFASSCHPPELTQALAINEFYRFDEFSTRTRDLQIDLLQNLLLQAVNDGDHCTNL